MKRKTILRPGLFGCLIVLLVFASNTLAMTDRPPRPAAGENQDPYTPDQGFQEGDAIRYGGLFGPLPDPFEGFPDPFGIDPFPARPPSAGDENPLPQSRDMGFGAGIPGFSPINTGPRCPEGALSCPG